MTTTIATSFDIASCVIFDLETYPGRWCVGFHGLGRDGKIATMLVDESNELAAVLTRMADRGTILVGFNSDHFDVPLIRGILRGIDPYAPAQSIIRDGQLPRSLWNLPAFPSDVIDLSARVRRGGTFPGLKAIAANLGRPKLQELPFDPGSVLSDAEWQEVKAYNAIDLGHTWALLERFGPELQAIAALSNELGRDLRSTSTPQIVERVFLDAYHREHGSEPQRPPALTEVTYRPVEGVRRPNNPDAAAWFDQITAKPIPIVNIGERQRVSVPRASFSIGKLKLSVGAGGLHSVDSARVYYSTRKHRLVSVDVASFYPSLIATKAIAPRAYGDTGAATYKAILERRLEIKRGAKTVEDEQERERLDIEATALKLVLNSTFGKYGDSFSTLFDPGAMLAVTLSGQLMLIDLIERLTDARVRVLSANTDGLFLHVPRRGKRWRVILREWQRDTGMRLDVDALKRLAILATNNFATLDAHGKVKRKGDKLKGSLNPVTACNALVINDAIAEALLRDVPPERTVRACTDPVRFCRVSKRTKQVLKAVLVDEATGQETELPKITRWYRAKDSGKYIVHRLAGDRHTTPPNATSVNLALDLGDGRLPSDLDRSWYIAQARRIVQGVPGYRHRSPKRLEGHSLALDVLKLGLLPVPKWNGKAQLPGSDPASPTLLWDWSRVKTVGTFTGPAVGILVIDIDEAERFRRWVKKGNEPLFDDRWRSLDGCLVSLRGNLTGDAVRSGKLRGKLIFRFASDGNHPIAKLVINKFKATRGFEVFYGKGLPSLLGEYPGDEPYRLEGVLTDAPAWLIEGITVKSKAQRQASGKSSTGKAHTNGFTPHTDPMDMFDQEKAGADDLESLKSVLVEISGELDKPTVGWRRKDTSDGRVILVGRCPFDHDSGESDEADLSAGWHTDGPYIHCHHASCTTVREINAKLKAKPGPNTASDAKSSSAVSPPGSLPAIEITTDRYTAAVESIKALAADHDIYCRGASLGIVVEEESAIAKLAGGIELENAKGSARFLPLSRSRVGCYLTKNALFFRWQKDRQGGDISVRIQPPSWLIESVETWGLWPGIRSILTITQCPYVWGDGSIAEPGYDPVVGALYRPNDAMPIVRERPSKQDAIDAADRLLRLVHQFPFKEGVDFSVWLAALLTAIQRPVIGGPVPGFAFTANKAGSGKGLLIDLVGILAWGNNIPTRSYPIDPAECGKVKLSLALAGIGSVHFDNLPEGGFYGSGELDSALTSTEVSGRILGASKESGSVPLRPVWLLSGNNVSPYKDAYRRWVPCRLNTALESPHERDDLTVSNLRQYAREHRSALLADALTILRAHAITGRKVDWKAPLGSFEQWDEIVRGAVWFATGNDCLVTQRTARDEAPDRLEKVALLNGWSELTNGQTAGYTIKEAVDLVRDQPAKYATLNAVFGSIVMKDGKTTDTATIGRKFRAMKGQNNGGWILELVDTAMGGVSRWRVRKA